MKVLDNIPVKLELEEVLKLLQLRNRNRNIEAIVEELIELAQPIAKPKAVYEVSRVDSRNGDTVDIDGTKFTGRLLKINLEEVERVFPYITTCGRELDEIVFPLDDIMKAFCWDAIKLVALGLAKNYLSDYLIKCYGLGKLSYMNPGDLEFWPITQQKELFSIFGDAKELIGVELTKSYVMVPTKSSSGICYPSETEFVDCKLCPMKRCHVRKAAYDPELAKKYREDTV